MARLRSNTSFVRLFLGRLVTNAGDSLYLVAAMWLVYDLTGSSFYTGVAGFLIQAPNSVRFLFGPLVDRWDLRRILVVTQLVQCVCVLVVPLAAALGYLSVWVVLVVMPLLSLLNQFVYPAHSAALPRIVDDENLVRANSLFSTAYQGADMVFNAASGVIIAAVGAVTLFAVDSITFALAALLFVGVAVPSMDEDDADSRYVDELRDGLGYLRGSVVQSMILGAMVANLGAGAMLAVLPAFADSFGGPETYGLLMAALAAGQLLGAVAASALEDWSYGYVSVASLLLTGASLFVMVAVPGRLGTVTFLFVGTIPLGAFNVLFFSLLQSAVDDALLGRVTSAVSSGSTLMIPVGSLLGGVVSQAVGPAWVLSGLAGLISLTGLYFFAHPSIRTLPAIAETDETRLGLRGASES